MVAFERVREDRVSTLAFSRVKTATLRDVSIAFREGTHAVMAEPEAGGVELVALAAGILSPSRGRVTFDGDDPHRTPALRRRTGSLLADEPLLGEGLVKEAALSVLRARRASGSADDVLGPWDLLGFADRRVSSLSARERRAVALVLALAVTDARVLSLYEPLRVGLDSGQVLARLSEHAARGAVVLAVTASAEDAARLSSKPLVLDAGRIVGELAAPGVPLVPITLWVGTSGPRELSLALRAEPSIARVTWQEGSDSEEVGVFGEDPTAVALAVLRAAAASGAKVHFISEKQERPRLVPFHPGAR
jgi:energy-coupling factor transporter ATP-binding protein EcfA2